MDNNRYKLIATGVTLSVYLVAFFSILSYISTVHYSAKIKSSSEEIVIDITAFQPQPKEKEEETPPPKPKEETVPKKAMAVKSVKSLFDDDNTTLDEKDLFSKRHIPPTRRTPKKIDVNDLFDASVERQQVSKNIVDKMEKSTQKDTGNSAASSEGVTDAYFAQVQEAIAAGWNPLARQKGMEASLVLKIARDGSFTFFIRGVNGDKEFLDMLKQHMEKLQRSGLPKPEKSTTINTNFIAKE